MCVGIISKFFRLHSKYNWYNPLNAMFVSIPNNHFFDLEKWVLLDRIRIKKGTKLKSKIPFYT